MKKNILFQLSGSIAAYKSCVVISKLVQKGFNVKIAATANALKFIGEATLEGLTGSPVFTNVFQPSQMMDHIHLAHSADLSILCPATANTINKIANGIADDAVGSLFLAHDFKKPYLIAPAMNHSMLNHPATQKNLATLKCYGVKIFPTEHGHQACEEIGDGRLINPEIIFETIITELSK